MANITYNNIPSSSATSFVTLSDIPNILSVRDSSTGTHAILKLTVGEGWTASANNQWWLEFLGETISNVLEPQNAINKNFYIAGDERSTAASMCKALRSCPTVSAKFQVYLDVDESSSDVYLKARDIGDIDLTVTMTTGMSTYLTVSTTGGTATSGLINNKIDLDIYSRDEYITTLEKTYYGGECAFDVTPVLSTMAERGKTKPYSLYVSSIDNDGIISSLGYITGNTITEGYLVNQGFKYIPLATLGFFVAQNYSRGEDKAWDNNSVLYVYGDTIPVSWYSKSLSAITASVVYLSSAYAEVHSESMTLSDSTDGWLHNSSIQLNSSYKNDAYYIALRFYDGQVELVDGGVVYNVIKPLKATEYYQRVYWRNSYGGISFFDFTAKRSEARDIETTTYSKNVYDFYTQDRNEQDIIYNVDTKNTVTLKSHIIEKDGTYLFNDLMQAGEIWTEVNGEEYGIILDSVSVEETSNNNLFEATIKFKYSQPTSL